MNVRSMQIYVKLNLHVQIEQDFLKSVKRTVSECFFKYKLSKQITCFAFKIMLSSLSESNAVCTHATEKLKRHFETRIFSLPLIVFHHPEDLPPLRNLLTFPRDNPQPGFFLQAGEKTLGTRFESSYSLELISVLTCTTF